MVTTTVGVQAVYTYAWWLSGDPERARSLTVKGLQDATSHTLVSLPRILRTVRAGVQAPAELRPEAELALLHDGLGLSLTTAAALVGLANSEIDQALVLGRRGAAHEGVCPPDDVDGSVGVSETTFVHVPIEIHRAAMTRVLATAPHDRRKAGRTTGVGSLALMVLVCLALLLSLVVLSVQRDDLIRQAAQDDTLQQVLGR